MEYSTQNTILLSKLLKFYNEDNNLEKILPIINAESQISLQLIDWFATNYAKNYYTVYDIQKDNSYISRFKVYNDYKLKLKAYSKKRFDPFCRWERITFPYKNDTSIQTTIGQLNFFKWALENKVIQYIKEHYKEIENDMVCRNSTSRKKKSHVNKNAKKTRKKREELSVSATKSIKKEKVEIILKFS